MHLFEFEMENEKEKCYNKLKNRRNRIKKEGNKKNMESSRKFETQEDMYLYNSSFCSSILDTFILN